ncbi:MAG: peptidylprolyl isomerase [Chloroflexi bacterium]|nr:peptidylprolyl isomerase [Chloroflexota bacterium]
MGDRRTWLTGLIIASVFAAVIVVIFGVFYYQQYIGPFRRIVITVDGTQIRMDYFLKRVRLAGADPMFMLQSLTNELVVKSAAPVYGITVTEAEVNDYIRQVASGGGDNMTDVEFREWYRQQLNNNRLSDADYREIAANSVLTSRMKDYLAERMPSVSEQVYVNAIVLRTFEEAKKTAETLKSGTGFATLAGEVSIDPASRENGGAIGWMPRNSSVFDNVIFDLQVGEISDPFPYYENYDPATVGSTPPDAWFVLMVSEKDNARQLEEMALNTLKSRALEIWLMEELKLHNIEFNFNSENYAWMKWQLARSQTN